jgi:FixJ family two-component response regulator
MNKTAQVVSQNEKVQNDGIVFVVDDDESVRKSLGNLIRSAWLRVETFASAQQFLASTPLDVPSCLVLDVRMPRLNGLELQKRLAEIDTDIPIIFITAHADVATSVRAMKAGAVEFLTKPFRDEDLLDAIHQALERDRVVRQQKAEVTELRIRRASLTPREREVMELVVSGLLNKQIAFELGISETTIKVHRAQVMKKMLANSLADLVKMSQKLGSTRTNKT